MKILHIITLAEIGGAQSVVNNLVAEALRDGNQVMVASSEKGGLWDILPPDAERWKIRDLQREVSLLKDMRVMASLRKANRAFRPDIIHLHSSKIGVLGRLCLPASKIIYTVHGFDSVRHANRKFLFLEKLLQNKARHIVGVSRYDHVNMLAEGISTNVCAIANGIADHTIAAYDTNVLDKAKDVILSKPGFRIMCIARVSPQKNFPLFLEIARQLSDEPVNFFWIGNKEKMTGLPDNVFCLGEINDAHRLLPLADLFLLPTRYEGLPVSILEALCYGVPVIASDVGGISEILNGQNGTAVSSDAESFIREIKRYMNNDQLLANARKEARRSYEENFTINLMYKAYKALY
ncbi:glycosyltransferase [Dyadobacter sandarakinus]|uniref:Glycosyltransferase n=1 Tax=Dyadobacter sandarakinus TaxID=2747268 RepID=A0ABX7ID51_9BACT|nr:glycosyltransferase [Dyadobacter sandarakinus]QRR03387.1 glycosyltransferase [Dyadobacter sandarakinus]